MAASKQSRFQLSAEPQHASINARLEYNEHDTNIIRRWRIVAKSTLQRAGVTSIFTEMEPLTEWLLKNGHIANAREKPTPDALSAHASAKADRDDQEARSAISSDDAMC